MFEVDVEHLITRWREALADGARSRRVELLVLRTSDDRHEMPGFVELDPERGLLGDRWAQAPNPHPEAQISLMDRRVVDALVAGDRARWHVPGDNIIVDADVSEAALPVGTRLRLGEAIVEVTAKPHAGCAKFCSRLGKDALAWVNAAGRRHLRLRGVYARVLSAGICRLGDIAELER